MFENNQTRESVPIPGTRGGRRPGSGRKVGAATVRTREAANKIASEDVTPLELMFKNMSFWIDRAEKCLAEYDALGPDEDEELLRRKTELLEASLHARQRSQECAVQLAPYVHPRLSTVALDTRSRTIINYVFSEADSEL